MKFSSVAASVLLASQCASASTLPQLQADALDLRDASISAEYIDIGEFETLEKRKGGGGRSGGSSSSGSSSGSGTSSSGSSSGGSRGGSSGGTGSSAPARSSPSYGGFYGGGAAQPYRAGASRGSITPFLLGGAALGFLGVGALAAGAYLYDFPDRWNYFNQTSNSQQNNVPVKCYCEQGDAQCSCDPTTDQNYINSVVGDGSWPTMQQNGLYRATNGTLYINGTVASADTSAAGGRRSMLEATGWLLAVSAIGASVWTGAV